MNTAAPAATATRKLHCFHHAGGTPLAFGRWKGTSEGIDCVGAVMEDGDGLGQTSIEELVAHWRLSSPAVGGVFYGHSMGALVAFEAAWQAFAAEDSYARPSALVLGSPPWPDGLKRPTPPGLPQNVRERVAAGLARVSGYDPADKAVPVPIHVLWGGDDRVVGEGEARRWVRRGAAGSSFHVVEGAGHLFHQSPSHAVLRLISSLAFPTMGEAS